MTEKEKIPDRIKEVDLSGCEEIGRGQCAGVYRINDDRVIKVFFETFPMENILREYERTCEANRLGINSVECFGMVSWQGRTGIELELVKGTDLETMMLNDPDSSRGCGRQMAEELKTIHSKRPDKSLFPPLHEFYLDCVEKCRGDGWITENEAASLNDFIHAIPLSDAMIHGDYHILNIIADERGIKLIDMADCTTGNPVYDLLVSALYMHFVPTYAAADLYSRFFKISKEQLLSCWDAFVRSYFDTEDEKRISRINAILDVYSMLKVILAPYSFSNTNESDSAGFVEMGRAFLIPQIHEYTGVIPADICMLGKE